MKRCMTLLETLVALSLLTILLVFVFGFFRELSVITSLTEKSEKESFQMRYLESRLGFIFERIVNENTSGRTFIFYTEPPNENSSFQSLVLTFDNEARLNPVLSGDVLGKIYVDHDNRLCLAIWPLFLPNPHLYMQEEVLMDHVVKISYEFYAAPEKISNTKSITSTTADPTKENLAKDIWHHEWPIKAQQMPSIVKIFVDMELAPDPSQKQEAQEKKQVQTLTFYFVLPSSQNPIHYPAEAV